MSDAVTRQEETGCVWQDQTILVTGAARRLGRSLVEALAARGAGVAIHYHQSASDARALARAVEGRARRVWLFQADLRQPDEQERLAREVTETCQPLTGLVNNASLYLPTPLKALTRKGWDEHLAINLSAPVWLSQSLGLEMKRQGSGSIVQVGDWSTQQPYRNRIAYTVSKGGLETATRALARELAPEVRVNMVVLGPILLPEGSGPDLEHRVSKAVPLARVGHPREYVEAVLYLLATGTYCTGSFLTLDGGRHLA